MTDLRSAVLELCSRIDEDGTRDEKIVAWELRQLCAQYGWQPIESAPKDGAEVILFSEHLENVFAGYWDERGAGSAKSCWRMECGERVTPTRWMPLPEVPK